MVWRRFKVASYPPFLPDVAMTGSQTETSLPSHGTPRFRYFKSLMRVLVFELSLSLQKRPQDLTHRLGRRTGTNPDFELLVRQWGNEQLAFSRIGKEHRCVEIRFIRLFWGLSRDRGGFSRHLSDVPCLQGDIAICCNATAKRSGGRLCWEATCQGISWSPMRPGRVSPWSRFSAGDPSTESARWTSLYLIWPR